MDSAPSALPVPSSPLGSFTVEHFIDHVAGKEFECPVCYGIMFQVREIIACGHLLCDSCITKLEECPLCKCRDLDHKGSKYLERRLWNQIVRCSHEHCERTFPLNEARDHLAKEHGVGAPTPATAEVPDVDYDEIVHQFYPVPVAESPGNEIPPTDADEPAGHDVDPGILAHAVLSDSEGVSDFVNLFRGLVNTDVVHNVTLKFSRDKIGFQAISADGVLMAVGRIDNQKLEEYSYRGDDDLIMTVRLRSLMIALWVEEGDSITLICRESELEVVTDPVYGHHHRIPVEDGVGWMPVPDRPFDSVTRVDVRYLRGIDVDVWHLRRIRSDDESLGYVDLRAGDDGLRITVNHLTTHVPASDGHQIESEVGTVSLRVGTSQVRRIYNVAHEVNRTVVRLFLCDDHWMAVEYDLAPGPVYLFVFPSPQDGVDRDSDEETDDR